MTEYIVIGVGTAIFLLDDYLAFLPKSLVYIIAAAVGMAVLHLVIKDAVVEAIKETK